MPGYWERAFGRGLLFALICYLLASSYAIPYEFCWTLWTRGTDDYGFHRSHRSASAWAVFIWVLYGVVRPIWVTAWVIGRIRTLRTKIRLVGRKACMQTDLNTVLGRYRPERLRDSSGRPRFCKWNLGSTGCFDGGRPLGDRVYHCSYVNEKCEKDQQLRGIHLPVYDHYCNWIGITVYLMTVKPYLLVLSFLTLDALMTVVCSVVGIILFPHVWHFVTLVLAAIVVVWLATVNVYRKFRDLAIRNITLPEINYLERSVVEGARLLYWFRISLDRDSGIFLYDRFDGQNPNPWDLGARRNLYQIFGGWDCLLPWTQPPRAADYGNLKHEYDFEMSDEFKQWVEKAKERLRLRDAGSQAERQEPQSRGPPPATPVAREETQSRGSPPGSPQLSPPTPPLIIPTSPRQFPCLYPVFQE